MGAPHPRIGFLGLGTMGRPMAANLLKAGFPLTVWNRSPQRIPPLVELGAKAGAGPAAIAAASDIVITMVGTPADVEEVSLGAGGVMDGLREGAVYIDMSTVSPETSLRLAKAAQARGADFLDAPVVGSVGPATDGKLVILAGGPAAAFERCRPILYAMGKTLIHAGGHGKGAALKLATNLMLAHLASGFAEGLLLVQRSGVDPKRFFEVLEASPFRSAWYASKGAGMLARDFSTHFALKHMAKDVRLMNRQAEAVGVELPITEAIERLYAAAEGAGLSEQDYSAILAFIEAE